MTESQIQKKIIDYLESIGAYVFKTIKCNRSGVPDVIGCFKGHFIAFEVKVPGGKVSPLQEHHVSLVFKSGGHAAIVFSLDDVKNCLQSWQLI